MRINININITTIIVRFVILLLFAVSCMLAINTSLYKLYYEREMISTGHSDLIDVLKTIEDAHFAEKMRGAKYNDYGNTTYVQEGRGYISDKQLIDYIKNYINISEKKMQGNENTLSIYIEYLRYTIFSFALFFVVLLIHLTSTVIRKINNNKSAA